MTKISCDTLTDEQKRWYLWLNESYWGGAGDAEIAFRRVRIGKTRLPHNCPGNAKGELHPIPVGSLAVIDTAKCDGHVGTCYTCLPCLRRWAMEIGEQQPEIVAEAER